MGSRFHAPVGLKVSETVRGVLPVGMTFWTKIGPLMNVVPGTTLLRSNVVSVFADELETTRTFAA